MSHVGARMKEYRVYLLDGDGKIASACWVEAPTLRKAIAEVSQNFGSTCEVWNGAERLAVVHPLQVESRAPTRGPQGSWE